MYICYVNIFLGMFSELQASNWHERPPYLLQFQSLYCTLKVTALVTVGTVKLEIDKEGVYY